MSGFRTDVREWKSPTMREIRGLISRLGQRQLTVPQFQKGSAPHLPRGRPVGAVGRLDRRVYRQRSRIASCGARSWQLGTSRWQLLYMAPNTAHPPHYHFNHVSTQLMMAGRMRAREYERIARMTDDSVTLMPVYDGVHEVGDTMQTAEFHRNVHWFAAETEPTVFLNFNVHGLESETFEPDTGQHKGRNTIDPTVGGNERHLIGHKMGVEESGSEVRSSVDRRFSADYAGREERPPATGSRPGHEGRLPNCTHQPRH